LTNGQHDFSQTGVVTLRSDKERVKSRPDSVKLRETADLRKRAVHPIAKRENNDGRFEVDLMGKRQQKSRSDERRINKNGGA